MRGNGRKDYGGQKKNNMEICINMDKRLHNNRDNSLRNPSGLDSIINVNSLKTIIKHPIMAIKIICVAIFGIILFVITLIVLSIEDRDFFNSLIGKKKRGENGN